MVALVIERQDEKPGEIKDIIQRENQLVMNTQSYRCQ